MTDTTIVTDPLGMRLDELPIAIERNWKLERTVNVARGSFTIPANHPKATYRNLAPGNLVFVYSSDYPTLPNWAGMIWPSDPKSPVLANGELTFQVRSTEWILHNRLTDPICQLTGTPGNKLKQLLLQAVRGGTLPISMDFTGISPNGISEDEILNLAPIYEASNDLANNNDAYWYFDPFIDPNTNLLQLRPVFRYRRSAIFPKTLTMGGDANRANFIAKEVYEFREIANRVTAVGHFEDDAWADPIIYPESNPASISLYKQIYHKRIDCPEITTKAGLVAPARAELAKSYFVKLAIDGIVTAAPYPRIGDICRVETNDLGAYMTAQRSSILTMQCDSVKYTPQLSTLAVHLTEAII